MPLQKKDTNSPDVGHQGVVHGLAEFFTARLVRGFIGRVCSAPKQVNVRLEAIMPTTHVQWYTHHPSKTLTQVRSSSRRSGRLRSS